MATRLRKSLARLAIWSLLIPMSFILADEPYPALKARAILSKTSSLAAYRTPGVDCGNRPKYSNPDEDYPCFGCNQGTTSSTESSLLDNGVGTGDLIHDELRRRRQGSIGRASRTMSWQNSKLPKPTAIPGLGPDRPGALFKPGSSLPVTPVIPGRPVSLNKPARQPVAQSARPQRPGTTPKPSGPVKPVGLLNLQSPGKPSRQQPAKPPTKSPGQPGQILGEAPNSRPAVKPMVIKQKKKRLSDGYDAYHGQFPSFIKYKTVDKENHSDICGGTILDPHWAAAPAHCVRSAKSVTAYMGFMGSQFSGRRLTQRICVSPRASPRSPSYDIALLYFKNPIKMSDYTQPACLPLLPISRNVQGLQVGMGQRNANRVEGGTLRVLPVQPRCVEVPNESLSDDMTCLKANGIYEGTTCAGDSGSSTYCIDNCQNPNGIQYSMGQAVFTTVRNCAAVAGEFVIFDFYKARDHMAKLIEICSASVTSSVRTAHWTELVDDIKNPKSSLETAEYAARSSLSPDDYDMDFNFTQGSSNFWGSYESIILDESECQKSMKFNVTSSGVMISETTTI